MFERIKILTLLQLGGKSRRRAHTKNQTIVNCLIKALIISAITVAIYMVLGLIKSTLSFPINKSVLTFLLFVSQYIGILTCTVSLSSVLYSSRDNAILLSYPAKPNEVFVSKLVVAYLGEFNKNLYFLFPVFFSFGLLNGCGVWYFISSIIMLLFMPIFPVFIGALLSIPLQYIKKLLNRFPIAYAILILLVVVALFWGVAAFVAIIPKPLRLLAMYNRFINGFLTFVASANQFGLFYNFMTNIMYSVNIGLNLLWLVLIVVGIMLLTNYVSMPLYFNLASRSNEHAVKSKTKKIKIQPARPTLLAFLTKEVKLTFRNINKVMNDYFLILMMPVVLYIMNVAFSAIVVSRLGQCMITGFNVLVGMVMVTACNTQSATAITVEGGEFVLLKTAPSKTSNMVWAKMLINVAISTFFIFASAIMMSVSQAVTIQHTWLIFLTIALANFSHILWSFQLDITNPRLRDYAESGKLDGNPNVNKSVRIGLLIGLVFGIFSIILLNENMTIGWVKIICIALALLIFRLLLFVKNLKVFFKRIEY